MGGIEKLEVYRKFRTVYFSDINEFYDNFFSTIRETEYHRSVVKSLDRYSHDNWKDFPFPNDPETQKLLFSVWSSPKCANFHVLGATICEAINCLLFSFFHLGLFNKRFFWIFFVLFSVMLNTLATLP